MKIYEMILSYQTKAKKFNNTKKCFGYMEQKMKFLKKLKNKKLKKIKKFRII